MPTESFHESLYASLKTMVEATIEFSNQPEVLAQKSHMDALSWTKEFRTVRFGVGRRMGHTTMGLRLAEEMFPRESVFLALNNKSPRSMCPPNVRMKSSHNPEGLRGLNVKMVVVDCSTFLSQTNLDQVIRISSPCDPVIVLLQ